MNWSYPTLPEHAVNKLAEAAVENELATPGVDEVEAEVVVAGAGPRFEPSSLVSFDELVTDLMQQYASMNPSELRDWIEGYASAAILEAVDGLSILGLDDPGFWRYVSLRYCWNFIVWRESKSFRNAVEFDPDNEADDGEADAAQPLGYRVYIDGRRPAECVPLRMYLRARIARDGGDPAAAARLEKATDFWRSHIVRVRTGTAPVLAAAFVEYQSEHEMTTDPLRDYARRLNRLWSNVQLSAYDDPDACAELLSELGD
jgi:hypothetical protein